MRGKNNLGIEDGCTYAVPKIPEDKIVNRIPKGIHRRMRYHPKSCDIGGGMLLL